jgi:hypothetical protein
MKKHIYDEKSGLHYKLVGDYYLPCLEAPEAPQIGVWGHRRRTYLREYNKALYAAMLISGELDTHLEAIDQDAEQMFERLMRHYAAAESITEELKAADQLEWVQQMNGIRSRVTEIVNAELIYQ